MSDRFAYNFAIEQCDILDKNKGKSFRDMRTKWIEWLHGEDSHSISRQISSILWDYALFITVNKLRKLADEEPEEDVGINGTVMHIFDAGFVTTQIMAIRRLIEKPRKNPQWAVISLLQVLNDIEQNLELMTRENYVCYDGLPYDYNAAYQKWISSIPNGIHSGTLPTNGPNNFDMSERVHKNFDILAQVDPKKRSRNDRIKIEVLNHLKSEVKKCESIKKYADKFIAHAAAPETRKSLSENEKAITLERLETCHKIIYQVASFISLQLLWECNIGGLPVPQYDHLKNLDKKWTTPKKLENTRKKWDEYKKEVSKWDSIPLWPPDFKMDCENKS